MRRTAVLFLLLLTLPLQALAQQAPAGRIADRTGGMQRFDGFVPFYWDAARGRVLMEVPAFDSDVLYYVSAASGAARWSCRSIAASSAPRWSTSSARDRACSSWRRTSGTAPWAASPRAGGERARLVRDVGARVAAGRGGGGAACARGRHAALHARRRGRRRPAAPRQPGRVPVRRRTAAASIRAAREGVPAETPRSRRSRPSPPTIPGCS